MDDLLDRLLAIVGRKRLKPQDLSHEVLGENYISWRDLKGKTLVELDGEFDLADLIQIAAAFSEYHPTPGRKDCNHD